MALCYSGRQFGYIAADDKRLGAKLCRGIGDIGAVSIWEHPIRHDWRVPYRLKASGLCAGGGDRIYLVSLTAQGFRQDLANNATRGLWLLFEVGALPPHDGSRRPGSRVEHRAGIG